VKVIKLVILSFIFLFAVVLAISLFIPSHIRVSRAINLKPMADVLNNVNDLRKWRAWYPGFDTINMEPVLEKESRLVSAKLQKTTTITLVKNERDEVKAEFKSGDKSPVTAGWKTMSYHPTDSITLQWYFDFRVRWYPWEKFFSLAYDKMYGAQMEMGLSNLKKSVER
jgi:hypothetical protein